METIVGLPKNVTNASIALFGVIYDNLLEHRKVHYETAISAASFLAGTTLIRAVGGDFRDKKPGEPFMSDATAASAAKLIEYMKGACAVERLDRDGGWEDSIPKDHRPNKRMLDLITEFEPRYRGILNHYKIPADLQAEVAAYTAVKFIKEGKGVLEVDVGKALAAASVIKAAKTIPPKAASPIKPRGKQFGRPWWKFWA